MTIKDLKYAKVNSVNPLYFIFNKVNGYFEEINGDKYLTLVPTNEGKEAKMWIWRSENEEVWSKIRDLIRLTTKNSDNYDEKHIKIRLNSHDKLPLYKLIEIISMIIVVRAIFLENKNFYQHVFKDECLCKI